MAGPAPGGCYQSAAMRAAALVLVLALLPACSLGGGAPSPSSGALAEIEIPEPTGVQWQRTSGSIELLGTTPRAVPGELALIAGALAEVPAAVYAKAPLRYLVRAPTIGSASLHPATAAFARGPDVYIVDRTFADPAGGGDTRFGLARVLLHELVHVAQFDTLAPDYVRAVQDGTLQITDTGDGSLLVADFAEAVGWSNSSSDSLRPRWSLSGSAASGTTEYGRTAPEEDMAESVALVALGLAGVLSPERIRWVEEWLGASAERLAAGKPWVPEGSRQARFRDPVYDEAAVAARRAEHAEPVYYELATSLPPADRLAAQVGSELRGRGLNGSLTLVADDRLPRYSGEFTRSDGLRFWVELWDFREASGFRSAPAGPVLTYVTLW